MDIADLLAFRREKDRYFKHADESPVPRETRHNFKGLSYFPPNDELVYEVDLEPVDPTEVTIVTTAGDERTYKRVATASFSVDGQGATVALYSSGDEDLFLPFRDATSGRESYGAGRYIDVHPRDNGKAVLDFNYAYSPFCAYSPNYSCAVPPQENWLTVPIRAGERITG